MLHRLIHSAGGKFPAWRTWMWTRCFVYHLARKNPLTKIHNFQAKIAWFHVMKCALGEISLVLRSLSQKKNCALRIQVFLAKNRMIWWSQNPIFPGHGNSRCGFLGLICSVRGVSCFTPIWGHDFMNFRRESYLAQRDVSQKEELKNPWDLMTFNQKFHEIPEITIFSKKVTAPFTKPSFFFFLVASSFVNFCPGFQHPVSVLDLGSPGSLQDVAEIGPFEDV